MALQAEFLGIEAQRQTDELRQVEHRHVQRAPGLAGGQRLLQVEVHSARKNLPAEFLAMLQRPPASAREEGAVHVGIEAHRTLERLTDAWG